MRFFKVIFIAWFALLPRFVQAQQMIALDKPGHVNRIRFHLSDEIGIQLKNERIVHKAVIIGFADSALILNNGMTVPLGLIHAVVDYRKGKGGRFLKKLFLKAFIGYFGFGMFNRLNTGEAELTEPKFLAISGSMLAAGLISSKFTKRTYRIRSFRQLKILNLSPV